MKHHRALWASALIIGVSALAHPALAQDRAGSQDPAFLPRAEGATIRQFRPVSVGEIVIPTGPVANADRPASVELLEGDVAHIDYVVKPAVDPLAVEQHYRTALQQAGYEVYFACAGETQCGPGMASLILNSGHVAPVGLADGIFSDKIRVLVARQGRDWVLMHVNSGPDAAHIYVATVGNGVAPQ